MPSVPISLGEQIKRARNYERSPAKAVPEAIRRRPTPKSLPCKAVSEGKQNAASTKRHSFLKPSRHGQVHHHKSHQWRREQWMLTSRWSIRSLMPITTGSPKDRDTHCQDGSLLGRRETVLVGGSGRLGDILVMPNRC